MDQERNGGGPAETADVKGPEFGATPSEHISDYPPDQQTQT